MFAFIWTPQSYTYHRKVPGRLQSRCNQIRQPWRAITDKVPPKGLRACRNCAR